MINNGKFVAFVIGFILSCGSFLNAYAAEGLVGIAMNKKVPVVLGEDLGFGKKYRLSLKSNFQNWGLQKVSEKDGHPVRLGNYSLRFETREGTCGWEPKGWNDCRNGRSRHELSTAVHGFDAWNKKYWYAISVFIPENYNVQRKVGNSMFQFLARGKPNWLVKFDDSEGLFVQREFDFKRVHIISAHGARGKWNDFVIRITHSTINKGRFTVWRNGRQAFDHIGQTARKVSSKHKPYFKFGIYNTGFGKNGAPIDGKGFRNGKGLPNLVLYYDEIRVAKSCKKLKLDQLGYNCAELLE